MVRQLIFGVTPDDGDDLGGFRSIPTGWAIDWQLFIGLGRDAEPAPQLSYKIDTSLVHPLGNLPSRIAKDPSSLALRNLMRGAAFQLPSGQQVAAALGIPPIADEELMIGPATVGGERRPITEVASGLAGNAPLWVYILSEAQVMSWKNASGPVSDGTPIRLGPVGRPAGRRGLRLPAPWRPQRPISMPNRRSSRSRISLATERSGWPS